MLATRPATRLASAGCTPDSRSGSMTSTATTSQPTATQRSSAFSSCRSNPSSPLKRALILKVFKYLLFVYFCCFVNFCITRMQPVYLKQFQTQFVFRRCKQTCFVVKLQFLPRCMEGQRGLATRKLSVRPSVSLSNAWIVTKQKKVLPRFFIPYERSFSLVHCEEEWLVGATPST